MKTLVTVVFSLFILVGCGSDDQDPKVNQFNQIRSLIKLTLPGVYKQIQSVPVDKLVATMKDIANSGMVSESDAAVLLDPTHQQVLVETFTLLQGGSNLKQKQSAMKLVAATDGDPRNFSNILETIMEVLQVLAPIIGGLDPAIGAIIQLLTSILPVILELIEQFINPVLTYQVVPTAWTVARA